MRVSGVSRIHAEKKGNFLLLPLRKKKYMKKRNLKKRTRCSTRWLQQKIKLNVKKTISAIQYQVQGTAVANCRALPTAFLLLADVRMHVSPDREL